MEDIQRKFEVEIEELKKIQNEHMKAINTRHQLDAQLNENSIVKQELDLLKEGNEVYKMIGPVLVKMDLDEAKQNVSKRMDYIKKELSRSDEKIASLDKKQDAQKEKLQKMELFFREAQAKIQQSKV